MKNKQLESAVWFILFESIFWSFSNNTIINYWTYIKNSFIIPQYWDIPISKVLGLITGFIYDLTILSISIFCFYKFIQCMCKSFKRKK